MSRISSDQSLDRREALAGLVAIGGLAGMAPAAMAAGTGAIHQLYDKAVVIDGLASPNSWNVPFPPPGPLTPAQLANVKASGLTAVNLTVGKPGDLIETVREIAFWVDQIHRHGDVFLQVRTVGDILAAKRSGRCGLIFGFQGMAMIGRDLSLIDTFDQLGVRIMQLTYNDRNALGAGSSLPESEGLTALGAEAVARMNARGILVDVGHANPTTAIDAAKASKAPITISHTGSRAIFPSQRNLTDAAFRAVAEKGGVVGLYLMPFLGRDPVSPSKALFLKHLLHALDICGEDHVGIGSDQSITPVDPSPAYMDFVRKTAEARQKAGIGAPGEADGPVMVPDLNSNRRLELIAAELDRAKIPPRVIEKVIGANFLRLFREVWPA